MRHFLSLFLLAAAIALPEATYAASSAANTLAAQQQEAAQQLRDQQEKPNLDDRATYLGLIAQMQQRNLYYASLAHIDVFEQRWGSTPESSLLRADALRETGQTDAAQAKYSDLLNTPMAAQAYHGLGLLAGKAGNPDLAIQHLLKAEQLNPIDANVLNDLGYAWLLKRQIAQARIPLMKAAELDAQNPRVWNNLMLYLLLDGQANQAEALMNQRQIPQAARLKIQEQAFRLAASTNSTDSPATGQPVPAAANAAGSHAMAETIAPTTGLAQEASALTSATATTTATEQATSNNPPLPAIVLQQNHALDSLNKAPWPPRPR